MAVYKLNWKDEKDEGNLRKKLPVIQEQSVRNESGNGKDKIGGLDEGSKYKA